VAIEHGLGSRLGIQGTKRLHDGVLANWRPLGDSGQPVAEKKAKLLDEGEEAEDDPLGKAALVEASESTVPKPKAAFIGPAECHRGGITTDAIIG
jgi:hypothetical protein